MEIYSGRIWQNVPFYGDELKNELFISQEGLRMSVNLRLKVDLLYPSQLTVSYPCTQTEGEGDRSQEVLEILDI